MGLNELPRSNKTSHSSNSFGNLEDIPTFIPGSQQHVTKPQNYGDSSRNQLRSSVPMNQFNNESQQNNYNNSPKQQSINVMNIRYDFWFTRNVNIICTNYISVKLVFACDSKLMDIDTRRLKR